MAAAFAAACLLVLQSLAGAFALGFGPGQVQLDGFGNVICSHAGSTELPDDDVPVGHMPACCVLGCGMGVSALDAPPDAGGIVVRQPVHKVFYRSAAIDFPVAEPDWSPSNPRAPPAA